MESFLDYRFARKCLVCWQQFQDCYLLHFTYHFENIGVVRPCFRSVIKSLNLVGKGLLSVKCFCPNIILLLPLLICVLLLGLAVAGHITRFATLLFLR